MIGSLLHRPGRLMFVAGVIGIVTGISAPRVWGIRLHAPMLASPLIGTVFAAVAVWLAIGSDRPAWDLVEA